MVQLAACRDDDAAVQSMGGLRSCAAVKQQKACAFMGRPCACSCPAHAAAGDAATADRRQLFGATVDTCPVLGWSFIRTVYESY